MNVLDVDHGINLDSIYNTNKVNKGEATYFHHWPIFCYYSTRQGCISHLDINNKYMLHFGRKSQSDRNQRFQIFCSLTQSKIQTRPPSVPILIRSSGFCACKHICLFVFSKVYFSTTEPFKNFQRGVWVNNIGLSAFLNLLCQSCTSSLQNWLSV